jgi:uncharacterized membrane protein
MKKIFILLTLVSLTLACSLVTSPAPPELSITVTPATVSPNSDITLHIHAKNPSSTDWSNHALLIGYAKENSGDSMVSINQVPVNLPAGQSLDQDIPWKADINDAEGKYELRLVLVDEKNIEVAKAVGSFEFTRPVISVNINPAELPSGSPAVVHVEINNQKCAALQNMKLALTIPRQGEISGTLIQELPVTVNAGEVFSRDIQWNPEIPLTPGDYNVQAMLLTDPGSVQILQASVPVVVR